MDKSKFIEGISPPWYKIVLLNFLRQQKPYVLLTILSLLFTSCALGQLFVFQNNFAWMDIAPFQPLPWIRILFSALTFVTLGAVLYALRFYQLLNFIFVTLLQDRKTYRAIKSLIWLALMGFLFYYVQPVVIKYLNLIASIVFNLLNLILFLSPSLGITLAALLAYICLRVLYRSDIIDNN